MKNQLDQIRKKFHNRKPNILGDKHSFNSSVILPLVLKDNEIHILFEVRSMELKNQPGEICFPGGKIDELDENEEFTAIRELCEELGLQFEDTVIIAQLDTLVTPFRGIIYPFVGEIKNPEAITPNMSEVSEVFSVPLSYLLEAEPKKYKMNVHLEPQADFPFDLIPNYKSYRRRTHSVTEYFYFYEHYVIWGLTARILHNFLDIYKEKLSKG